VTGPIGAFQKESAPPILRLGHVMAFSSFLHQVGAPIDRLLRRQGLPVYCEDSDAFVLLARAWSYFDAAAGLYDPMIGWLTGQHVEDHNLSSRLLNKLESAPTLYQALLRLARIVSAEASHLRLGVHERRDDVLVYTCYPGRREDPGYMQSQFYQLQILLAVIRHFVGQQWVPEEMGTEHSVVPVVVQVRLPGCRILTQQSAGYIAVPRACLHKATRRVESDPGSPVLTENFDYADVVRAVLRPYLPDGYPTVRFAAVLMDTSVRTLTRRLSACGITYGALVDEVRFTVAKELLHRPDVRISQIAWSVGFDDHSHFTRMFRRVGGLTPGQIRQADLAAQE